MCHCCGACHRTPDLFIDIVHLTERTRVVVPRDCVAIFSFFFLSALSDNSYGVEREHGGNSGEPDASEEERVPYLGLVVALQGKGNA